MIGRFALKKRRIALVALFALAVTFLAACASPTPAGPVEVRVRLTEFKIELDKTSISAGPVKFVVDNVGSVKHKLALEPAGAKDQPFEVNGKEAEVEDIEPGESVTLEWTLDKPGQYQLACYEPGHFEIGMVTTFTVTGP